MKKYFLFFSNNKATLLPIHYVWIYAYMFILLSGFMFNDTKKQRSEWKQKQLSQHELEERQSWIDHDNELNEYYNNYFNIEREIIDTIT